MSRKYATPAASRNPAVRQVPYHVIRNKDDYKTAGSHTADHHERTVAAKTGHLRTSVTPIDPSRRKQSTELTREALDKMLAVLDEDRDLAGRKYEVIRRMLQRFFACRGCPNPDDLADETINVVARKIAQGQAITGDEPARYFRGVARNVLKEYWRRPTRWLESIDCLPQSRHPSEDPTQAAERMTEKVMVDRRIEELEKCLRRLPDQNRELIVRYYEYEGSAKKAGRRMLARQMGCQSNALRLRVHRIRLKLKNHLDEPIK